MALEPYVRRRWPDVLISWTRLLSGKVWDPLIGRDVLTGALLGTVGALSGYALDALPYWFNVSVLLPFSQCLSRWPGQIASYRLRLTFSWLV